MPVLLIPFVWVHCVDVPHILCPGHETIRLSVVLLQCTTCWDAALLVLVLALRSWARRLSSSCWLLLRSSSTSSSRRWRSACHFLFLSDSIWKGPEPLVWYHLQGFCIQTFILCVLFKSNLFVSQQSIWWKPTRWMETPKAKMNVSCSRYWTSAHLFQQNCSTIWYNM